MTKQSSHTGKA